MICELNNNITHNEYTENAGLNGNLGKAIVEVAQAGGSVSVYLNPTTVVTAQSNLAFSSFTCVKTGDIMHLCGFLYNNTNSVKSGSTILSLNMSYLSADNAVGICWCTPRFGTTYYGGTVFLNYTDANIVIVTNYSGDIGEIMVDISYKLRNP